MSEASSHSIIKKVEDNAKGLLLAFSILTMVPAPTWGQELPLLEELHALDPNQVFGHVRSRNKAVISGEFPAKIETISFRDGEAFKKGDLLVQFDCALLRAQKAKVMAVLDGANKTLTVEKRLLRLESGGQLDVDLASAKVAEGQAELKGINTKLSKCQLKAPYNGRVISLKVGEHQFVQTGAEILQIVEDGHLEIEFIVPSNWITQLPIGTAFDFDVSETGRKYKAHIVRRGAVVDPISRTLSIIAKFDVHPEELVSGMSGKILLNHQSRQ